MKIAFIYSYLSEETWSTPMSLAVEFQSRGWEVEIFSIVRSPGNYTDSGLQELHSRLIKREYQPDIIFYLDWGRFDSPYLDKKLYPEAFWIQEAGDEPQNFDRNFPKSERFHLTLSSDYPSVLKYREAGRNAIWFNHFADTVTQYKMGIIPKYDAVSTRGPGLSGVLDDLSKDLEYRFCNTNGHPGLHHSEALQQGKMVVQHSRWGEITRRIFEAMACGRMVLTDRLNDERLLHVLFRDGTNIVFYDTYQDCLDKINYYNSHDEEREEIALNGHLNVLSFHTQYHRVNHILEEHQDWLMSR